MKRYLAHLVTALAILLLPALSSAWATVAHPAAWWTFDNDDGQTASTYDGIISEGGPYGLYFYNIERNGAGGQPGSFFSPGMSTFPPPEHYITSGATFPGADTAYHMEGGTHRNYLQEEPEDPEDPPIPIDPRVDPIIGTVNDIFSWRDMLTLRPGDAGGLLDSEGAQGGTITYAFWLNIQAATRSVDSSRFGSDTSFLIGRASGEENGFSGEVSVRKVGGGLFNTEYALQVRNDTLDDGSPAPSGIQNSEALGITALFDEWHHYVIQYDMTGATGAVTMWQDGGTANGGLQGTLTGLGTKPVTGTFRLNQVAHPGANLKETGDFFIDDLAVWAGTLLNDSDVTEIYTQGLAPSAGPAPPIGLPGDTDLDGDVDTADLTTIFQNFTGDVGAAGGKNIFTGDTDSDRDVDTSDLTAGFQNFTGDLTPPAGLANNPDLVYDPSSGNVKIFADGANVVSFNWQSAGQFLPPADFSDLDGDVGFASAFTDNTASAIGWVSALALSNLGFDGPAGSVSTPFADLGDVFPLGLDVAGLANLLTNNEWAAPGGTGGQFDLVVVPEPGSLLLLILGLAGLGGFGRRHSLRRAR